MVVSVLMECKARLVNVVILTVVMTVAVTMDPMADQTAAAMAVQRTARVVAVTVVQMGLRVAVIPMTVTEILTAGLVVGGSDGGCGGCLVVDGASPMAVQTA